MLYPKTFSIAIAEEDNNYELHSQYTKYRFFMKVFREKIVIFSSFKIGYCSVFTNWTWYFVAYIVSVGFFKIQIEEEWTNLQWSMTTFSCDVSKKNCSQEHVLLLVYWKKNKIWIDSFS